MEARKVEPELTKEQVEEATQWINNKLGYKHGCPCCGEKDVAILNTMGAISVQDPSGAILLGSRFPSVVSLCPRCAFMGFHNLMQMEVSFTLKAVDSKGSTEKSSEVPNAS